MARPSSRSDAEIREVIAELTAARATPPGSALREELKRRFGVRCGTDRIYRLLSDNPPPPPAVTFHPTEAARRIAQLTLERDAALARAERAEFRERAHQDMWAIKIDELRQELERLRPKRSFPV